MTDLLQNAKDHVKNLFLAKKADEFQSFAAREAAKDQAAGTIRMYEGGVADRRQTLEILQFKIESYQAVDLPNSIFKSLSMTGRPLEQVADTMLTAFILKTYGAEVLEIAKADLNSYLAEFNAWKRENAALLKEISVPATAGSEIEKSNQ